MGSSGKQADAAFAEKLALLRPEDRAAIHDRIDKLLAERHGSSQKTAPGPERRGISQGINAR
jgi:hypothetical protein